MRHGSCPSDASQNKSLTQAHERIGAGSGFPAADGPRGTSSPREQRHTRRAGTPEGGRSPRQSRPTRSKETDRNGLPASGTLKTQKPRRTAVIGCRSQLWVTKEDLNRVQHSRSPDKNHPGRRSENGKWVMRIRRGSKAWRAGATLRRAEPHERRRSQRSDRPGHDIQTGSGTSRPQRRYSRDA
jgi:hypothetical protein